MTNISQSGLGNKNGGKLSVLRLRLCQFEISSDTYALKFQVRINRGTINFVCQSILNVVLGVYNFAKHAVIHSKVLLWLMDHASTPNFVHNLCHKLKSAGFPTEFRSTFLSNSGRGRGRRHFFNVCRRQQNSEENQMTSWDLFCKNETPETIFQFSSRKCHYIIIIIHI